MSESNANRPELDLSLPISSEYGGTSTPRLWSLVQRVLGLFAGVALLPLLATVALVIKLTSPGPVFFVQVRPGFRGRLFRLVKFRTMEVGSEDATALGTASGDPAVTKIGKFLRDTKLDELPQLWNIVRGEMEIVGPRPIPLALHEVLARHIPGFDRRYVVRPGLTNVSQVAVMDNKLGDKLIADWSLRFEGELHYIENKSFFYDLIVIAMTFGFVAKKVAADQSADAA
jgi:putative colanic acid biosynthesis UDP-glucose lipid carrier transferase